MGFQVVTPEQLIKAWRAQSNAGSVRETVETIVADVRARGDAALADYARRFDKAVLKSIAVSPAELKKAWSRTDRSLQKTLRAVAANIRAFARKQRASVRDASLKKGGVELRQIINAIGRAGIYVPGGKHPLPSTALMGVIPAQEAGVREIVVCSPPSAGGKIHDTILAACHMLGVKEVYQAGGAQAVAAMAYGTESMRKVDKIAGPGNRYVNVAKMAVAQDVGIDQFAGPTELAVIADASLPVDVLTRDLLGQAEHGRDSKVVAVVFKDSQVAALKVEYATCKSMLPFEPEFFVCRVASVSAAVELVNQLAPEHVQLCVKNGNSAAQKLTNYGSLFLGPDTPSVLGDYSLGPNHTLPTSGAARWRGGLSIFDFLKIQTTQEVNAGAYSPLALLGARVADVEGLPAHGAALRYRMTRKP